MTDILTYIASCPCGCGSDVTARTWDDGGTTRYAIPPHPEDDQRSTP